MHGILHSLSKFKVLLVESQKRVAHRFGTPKTHARLAECKGHVDVYASGRNKYNSISSFRIRLRISVSNTLLYYCGVVSIQE